MAPSAAAASSSSTTTDARPSVTRTLSKTLSRTSTSRSTPVKGALEYGYPHGHLGHLTPTEITTFASFKALLAEHKLYTPATTTQPPQPASHDDATLLRYLRARRWDLPSAHKQFADTEAWRVKTGLDALYDNIDVDAYETARRLYPQWTGRRDKRGIPIYLFEIRHLDPKAIAKHENKVAASGGDRMGHLFALYENLTRFTQPLCTQLTDRDYAGRTPITLSTNIVDVSGVSLKGYWNLKGHMQAASELATAHYPETLDRIFIIGAPAFFTTVWGWIKRWFDPVTVSKIFILSPAEVLPTLRSFIAIENIPTQYGGQLEFAWNDRPKLDDTIKTTVSWENNKEDFPPGPLYWVPVDGGARLQCVARGSVDGKARQDVVGSVPVAVAETEEETVQPVVNGNGAGAASDEAHTQEQAGAVGANGAAVTTGTTTTTTTTATTAEEVASPVTEKFVDAPEEPLASPASPPGVEGLSLVDGTNEKAVEVTQTVPNGTTPAVATV